MDKVEVEVCPWCKEAPKVDIDVMSMRPYIKCENENCPVQPNFSPWIMYGKREDILREVTEKWNSYK